MRMTVVGRGSFSLNDKAVDAPELIVGERPWRLCGRGGKFLPLVD
jgi:hypothetical protein